MMEDKMRTMLVRVAPVVVSLILAACGGGSNSGTTASSTHMTAADAAEVSAAASAAAASGSVAPAIAMKAKTSAISDDSTNDRFIVRYKNGTSERATTAAVQAKLDKLSSAFPSKAHHLRRMSIGSDVVTTERALNASEAKAFMRAVASDPNVEFIEPDQKMTGQLVPNDSLYSTQWHLHSNQAPNPQEPGIRASGAWDITTGVGTVIAVVDTGVTHHSDQDQNILPGYDFVSPVGGDGFNPGRTTETCQTVWHGTLVAGVAAEVMNNNIGGAGVAPGAKIVPVRVLNACNVGFMSNVIDGIMWAAGGQITGVPVNPNPAKVINVSINGVGGCSQSFQSAIDYATGQGAAVVVSAGNNGIDVSQMQPANCRNVIAVGGTLMNGSNWAWSDFGTGIDIAAPGTSIWSTYNSGTTTPGAESYDQMDGTSAAAPQVSGVLALVNAVAPKQLSTAELRALLQQNAQPFPVAVTASFGPGIVDATKTVSAAKAGIIPVAADFNCTLVAATLWLNCKDLSTARGTVPIKKWAMNDGAPGSADIVEPSSFSPTLRYEYSGTYNVKETVTDANGAVSTVSRSFVVPLPPYTNIAANTPTAVSSLSADIGQNFMIPLPAGTKSVTASLSMAKTTDIANLNLKNSPTTIRPDCNKLQTGGVLTCVVNNPPAGNYFIMVYASSSQSLTGATLTVSYTQ